MTPQSLGSSPQRPQEVPGPSHAFRQPLSRASLDSSAWGHHPRLARTGLPSSLELITQAAQAMDVNVGQV